MTEIECLADRQEGGPVAVRPVSVRNHAIAAGRLTTPCTNPLRGRLAWGDGSQYS